MAASLNTFLNSIFSVVSYMVLGSRGKLVAVVVVVVIGGVGYWWWSSQASPPAAAGGA
jgi:hypothetical protein